MTLELSYMCQNITWSLPHSLWSKGPLSLAAIAARLLTQVEIGKRGAFARFPLPIHHGSVSHCAPATFR